MSISTIQGSQVHVQDILRCFLKNNKIPHSLLFIGPSGSGKTHFAKHLTQDLLCTQTDHGIACGSCKSCRMFLSGAHPDFYYFSSQEGASIGIDTARKIQGLSMWKPVYSSRKVIHIDDIHFLTIDAFNSMLKSLEEPNSSTIYLMTTSQVDAIPSTILSRTVRIPFYRLSTEQVKSMLSQHTDKLTHIDFAVFLSRGNMKKAIELMNDEKYNEIMQWIQKIIEFLTIPFASFPVTPKNDIQTYLDLWKTFLKEWYQMKLSGDKSSMIDIDSEVSKLIDSNCAVERLLLVQEKLIELEIGMRITRINQKSNIDAWMIQAKQLLFCH